MKKQFILAAVALIFATTACKKDVTCECTSSHTYTNSQGASSGYTNGPSVTTTVYKKTKKSDLKTICGDQKSTSTSTSDQNGTPVTTTDISETKCKIK